MVSMRTRPSGRGAHRRSDERPYRMAPLAHQTIGSSSRKVVIASAIFCSPPLPGGAASLFNQRVDLGVTVKGGREIGARHENQTE